MGNSKHRILKPALAAATLLMSTWLNATALNPNTADVQQNVSIPGMVIAVNPGGAGCKTAANEKWDTTAGGCSDNEYQLTTAKVVSVTPASDTIDSGSGLTLLTAVVKLQNGKAAPAGVAVTWLTTLGSLSSAKTYTDAQGVTSVTLGEANAGTAEITAAAVGGAAKGLVTVEATNIAPTITDVRIGTFQFFSSDLVPKMPIIKWESPDMTPETTIKFNYSWASYCGKYNLPKGEGKGTYNTEIDWPYSPDPGSTSWYNNGSQSNIKQAIWPYFSHYCPSGALKLTVTLCNGDACSSMTKPVPTSYTNDSM